MSDSVVLRKVYALNSNTGLFLSTNQLLLTDGKGGTTWFPLISSLTSVGGPIIGNLPSTFSTISSQLYTQSNAIANLEVIVGSLSPSSIGPLLESTTIGLGTIGYVSSSQLFSTVNGLGNTYVSTPSLFSTVTGLGSIGYISSLSLQSTLQSTTAGLGTAGYVSTTYMDTALTSSFTGLGGFPYRYVSSASLQSTVTGLSKNLGSLGYVSSTNLESTLNRLGTWISATEGYVSTSQLVSTTNYLLTRPVSFDTASNVIINSASTVVFNNVGSVFFKSSFTYSSLGLMGLMGTEYNAVMSNVNDMIFSTATFNLSSISSFISTTSKITLEYSPTLLFSKLDAGATQAAVLPISTFLQYDKTILSAITTNFMFVVPGVDTYNGISKATSTCFQQPIKFEIPLGAFTNKLTSNYTFLHMIPSGVSTTALANSNVSAYFCKKGSSAHISVFNTG